ncbi:M1-specific T cell receptor beta chain-like [Conger conger]|uniref:M1-specific T cell receptor beta chain-like n=1 Tax=Conger conger TaxID=82655 RepID=UPI002A59E309|nr:M1-specific T cell receptor beta chain-like [Conger conger]
MKKKKDVKNKELPPEVTRGPLQEAETILKGATGGVEFEQSPSLIARPGENTEIKCRHSESDYHNMYWYRQAVDGQVLVLIGFGHSREKPTYEAQFKARFQFTREAVQRSSLHISALTVEDTAVYFCAASSHSARSWASYSIKTWIFRGFEQHFGGGTRLTVVDPNVPVTAPQVRVLPSAPQEVHRSRKRKSKVTLVCMATGFYPDHIRVLWKVNGAEVRSAGVDSSPLWDESSRSYSLSSRIRIPAQDWLNSGNSFTCITSFYNGSLDLVNNHTIFGEDVCFTGEPTKVFQLTVRIVTSQSCW